MPEFSFMQTEHKGNIAGAPLNRTGAINALSEDVAIELNDALLPLTPTTALAS